MTTSFHNPYWKQTPKSQQAGGMMAHWTPEFRKKFHVIFNRTDLTPLQATSVARMKAIAKRVSFKYSQSQIEDIMRRAGLWGVGLIVIVVVISLSCCQIGDTQHIRHRCEKAFRECCKANYEFTTDTQVKIDCTIAIDECKDSGFLDKDVSCSST